jgi:hypothetical protein
MRPSPVPCRHLVRQPEQQRVRRRGPQPAGVAPHQPAHRGLQGSGRGRRLLLAVLRARRHGRRNARHVELAAKAEQRVQQLGRLLLLLLERGPRHLQQPALDWPADLGGSVASLVRNRGTKYVSESGIK